MNSSTLSAQSDEIDVARRLPSVDRRQQILEVAIRLFAEHGFSGTRTRAVAEAAGVNEALLFRYFAGKEDLYAAILEYKATLARTDCWVDELRDAARADGDRGVVTRLVALLVHHQQQDPAFLRLMLHSALECHKFAGEFRNRHYAPLYNFLLEYVQAAQAAGRFRRADPHALVRFMLAVPSYHALLETVLPMQRMADETPTASYTDLILGGVTSPSSDSPQDVHA
ncbi:MAG: TetR/AcrR family transcriptional regulator [Vicinamibacterales bacterium]